MYLDRRFSVAECDRHRLLVLDRSGTAVRDLTPSLAIVAIPHHSLAGEMNHGSSVSAVLLHALDSSLHLRPPRDIRTGDMEV
jgi:hypothetical protein